MKTTKDILKWVVIIGLFLVPFIPFLVPTAMFFPFITGKGFAFRILVEIVFGLYAILAFISPDYRPKLSWITKAVGLFTVAILVADLLGVNPYKSLWSNYERMEGFVLVLHLALFYIVASSMFQTVKSWKHFWNVSILASFIMSFYGLLQVTGHATINQGGVRLDGTFGNASYFAIYLVFHIFLCIYMLLDIPRPKWEKWVYGAIALFETVILYFTATRGAILGLIGGLLVAAILVSWKERENKKLRKLSHIMLGSVLGLILIFLAVSNTNFVKKSPVLSRFASLSLNEFQNQGRRYVWPMAIKGVIERPIFGWGQENFNFVFNKNYDPRMFGQEQWFDRTHDVFLDWLIAGGIVGFLSYASMYVALFYYIWRKNSLLKIPEKSVLTGLVAAYVFHNIFVFDNLVSYIMFFSLLAYVHAVGVMRKEETGKFHKKTFSHEIALYGVAPIVLVLIGVAVYFVNIPAIKANQTLIQALQQQSGVDKNLELFKKVYTYKSFGSTEATEQLVSVASQIPNSQVPDTLKQQFYDLAVQKIEEKVAQTPHDARYLVFAGSFFNRFGQYDKAIPYLERALVESPRKQSIFFELGSSYQGKQDFNKMFDLFRQAYLLGTTTQESKIIYAIGAIYTKNAEALQQLASQIDDQTIIDDNRFLKAFADMGQYDRVIAILTARLQKDPTNMQYKLSLASAYATIGQKQQAIEILRDMIKQDPTFKEQGELYIKQVQNQ